MRLFIDWLRYKAESRWYRLDGCTCDAIRGSHKPPCMWAMR